MKSTPTRVLVVADPTHVTTRVGAHEVLAAVEDAINESHYDEVIIGTGTGRVARLLHVDLPRKIAALGAAVTPVAA